MIAPGRKTSWQSWFGAALAAALVAAACTGPAAPTPPLGPPTIACPGAMIVPSPNGGPAAVIYSKPNVTGGALPIRTSCTPTVGATFGIGTTSVTCTTVDAQQRTASCGFNVTVSVPRLAVTSFVSFGDSITWGSNGLCARSLEGDPLMWAIQDVESLWANVNPPSAAYPGVLKSLLEQRYRSQSFTVANEGVPGERATGSGTRARLVEALNVHSPDVLLLQEGVNDLHNQRTPVAIADALTAMIREAKGRGILVFLGTLLPERDGPGSCRAFAPQRIVPANVQIQAVAAREGAVLVDLYTAFLGQEGTLLDQDGLHPSVAGYAEIGETFFDAIRARLEQP